MATRILGVVALAAVVGRRRSSRCSSCPPDANQGDAQRIMYVHVPSAWLAYLSFGVTALSGIAYLWRRDLRFDAVALAGAEIGVMFTAFAIWGGMMWGRPVWGVFWQWEDPRLTTTAAAAGPVPGLPADPAPDRGPVSPCDARRGGGHRGGGRHPHRPLQRRVVARPAPDGPTFGAPDKVLNPSAPMQFVIALVGMVVAFTIAWSWLMIRRYQLARIEWQIEEHGRLGRISAARRAALAAASQRRARDRAGRGGRLMQDLGFIVAAYGVILGGLALYAGLLLRRLAAARDGVAPHPSPGRVRAAARARLPRMTQEQPAPSSRSRWGLLLAVAIVVGAIAWLAFSGIGSALVYYRTPTELQALGEEAIGSSMRLGGLVEPGSLSCDEGRVAFTMTDGDHPDPGAQRPGRRRAALPARGRGRGGAGRAERAGRVRADRGDRQA